MHLFKSVRDGLPSVIFFAQFALFIAALFVSNTSLYAKHDSTGIKTTLSYQIISAVLVLVSNSRHLSGLGFIHRKCSDSKVNSIANLIYLILAIVFEHFYEKSLSSLGFALSITILFLILLVIIRPSTDLGLVDFLIGVIGSVAYGLFSLKFQTWIVVAICFLLLRFKCWLDENWLQKKGDQSPPTCSSTRGRNQISKSEIIEAITVVCFHLFWVYNLFRTNCRKIKGPPESISCASSPIMGILACVLIFNLWFSLAFICCVYSWFHKEITIVKEKSIIKLAEPTLRKIMLALSLLYVLDKARKIMLVQPLLYVLDKARKGVQKAGEGVHKAMQKVGEGVQKAGEGVHKAMQKAGEGVLDEVSKVENGVQKAGEGVLKAMQKAGEGVLDEVSKVEKGVQKAGEGVHKAMQTAGEGVQKAVQKVGEGVQKAGEGVQKAGEGVQKVGEGMQKAGEGVHKAMQKAGEGVQKAVQKVGEGVQNAGKDVHNVGKKAWKGIKKVVNKC